MSRDKDKVYRVLVSASESEADFEAGKVLRLRYLVAAPSPSAAKALVPAKAYRVDGRFRHAWRLPVATVTSVRKDPEVVMPAGVTIMGLDDASKLSLRVMAAVPRVS